jgi:8-oxo-dGTP pyrophosphatase MutT (NUDIX family)
MINDLKQYLQLQLEKELPGKIAHVEVAPYRKVEFNEIDVLNARKSGVLILFYLKNQEIYTVLTQRYEYDGKHSGQISFPGGKHEDADKDIYFTALREANEEIGVIIDDVDVIGQISNVFIPVSNFYVSPVLGFINHYPEFNIDNHEVEGLIELKLTDLISTKELTESKIKLANNTLLKVPSFIIDNKIVWGATALMLNELRHLLFEWE